MKSRRAGIVASALFAFGASLQMFLPFPREGGEVWLGIAGGAAAAIALATLLYLEWGWSDRGWKRASLIFFGSFGLSIAGLLLVPPELHERFAPLLRGLMLLGQGAVVYGFMLGVRSLIGLKPE